MMHLHEGNRPKILFGTGQFAEMVLQCIDHNDFFCFIDNSEKKVGTSFYGKPVYSLESVLAMVDIREYQIFIVSMYYEDIATQLNEYNLIESIHYRDGLELLSAKHVRRLHNIDIDIEDEFIEIYIKVRRYTMTSIERMYALYQAVKYIVVNKITGAFVECGVWRGGNAMLIAHTLLQMGVTDRDIYLYDTYKGFIDTKFSDNDIDHTGNTIKQEAKYYEENNINLWLNSSVDNVKQNLDQILYPVENIHYIIGMVEETLLHTVPDKVSLLRLDTDLYYSTYKELEYLYPLLEKSGILIVDDYGHWQGAKEAIKEYFTKNNITMLLNKIDYTGRMGIKM